ncbi:hypothetical protein BDR05DRAFT_970584 [Suillus weaverae]|nr:hypothetical protein BDR05DRAFT_970584 [Suillus weaverae]
MASRADPVVSRTTMNARKWNYLPFPMAWVAMVFSPLVQNKFFQVCFVKPGWTYSR